MKYNSQLKQLHFPEYGRTVQQMIDHCITIEAREERQKCAENIAQTMTTLFPRLKESEEQQYAVWDQIAIMSNFQLDIDYPCEIIQPEDLDFKPNRLPYSGRRPRVRHYGHYIDGLVQQAIKMEDSEERNALIIMTAIHMKRMFLAWNKSYVEDQHIYNDLEAISGGKIQITVNEDFILPEAKELQMDTKLMSGIKQRSSFRRKNKR